MACISVNNGVRVDLFLHVMILTVFSNLARHSDIDRLSKATFESLL